MFAYKTIHNAGSGGKGGILRETYCYTGLCISIPIHYDGIQPLLLHTGEYSSQHAPFLLERIMILGIEKIHKFSK